MTRHSTYWRKWLLILLMVSVIGIQLIESSHDHLTHAAQEACPVCQVAVHQPLDMSPTAVVSPALILPLLVILPFRRKVSRLVESFFRPYFSRAPPHTFA